MAARWPGARQVAVPEGHRLALHWNGSFLMLGYVRVGFLQYGEYDHVSWCCQLDGAPAPLVLKFRSESEAKAELMAHAKRLLGWEEAS